MAAIPAEVFAMICTMPLPLHTAHGPLWLKLISVFAVAGGVAKLFDWLDGLISDESRVGLWYFLGNIPDENEIDSWGAVLPKLFDKVFGVQILSAQFIIRSCIASVISVIFLTLLYISVHSIQIIDTEVGTLEVASTTLALTLTVGWAFVNNLIPDFLSLVFSRTILTRMTRTPTLKRTSILLALDTIGTAMISTCALWLSNEIQRGLMSADIVTSLLRLPRGLRPLAFETHHVIFSSGSTSFRFASISFDSRRILLP